MVDTTQLAHGGARAAALARTQAPQVQAPQGGLLQQGAARSRQVVQQMLQKAPQGGFGAVGGQQMVQQMAQHILRGQSEIPYNARWRNRPDSGFE
jgi:hypothetical protein